MKSIILSALGLVALAGLVGSPAARAATPLEPGFTETPFVHIPSMTRILWAPDGSNRLFATRKTGEIVIVKNGVQLSTPFAVVQPLNTSWEGGLLGLAFDPDFINNRYVYVLATVSNSEQQILRFTDVNDVGMNRTVIVPNLPTAATGNTIHVGGGLATTFDNHLFWSVGDNGTPSNAPNLTTLAGKVGRARLDGTAPNDNPFYDGAGPNNDYIWARGFRNPYSVTLQPSTGELWVNSCGEFYEQVWRVTGGENAGWPTYEANQPAGFLRPVFKYRTGGTDSRSITSVNRQNGVATFVLGSAASNVGFFSPGERITITGSSNPSFNGTFYVGSMPTTTSMTAPMPGANASSTGGTITTESYGGCIVGGGFYEGTLFPPTYRGNYFVADFVASRLIRIGVGPTGEPFMTGRFVNNVGQAIDATTGPDGALYYSDYNAGFGTVYRLAYTHSSQAIVLTPTYLNVREGSQGVVTVRLAIAPSSNVVVNVAAAGASSASVSPMSLTFTPQNWQTPQVLTVSAGQDANTSNDGATLTLSSSAAAASETVNVRLWDDDSHGFVVSTTALSVNEGSTGTFTVRLATAPASNVTATVARTAGDASVAVTGGASLTFTPANYATPQTVTVTANPDANAADGMATLTVSAAGLPARTVEVTAVDTDASAPAFTSMPDTTAVRNALWTYQPMVSGLPTPTLTLQSGPAGMTLDAPSQTLRWTPTALGTFPVTVVAQNGVAPNAVQSFSITVSADMAPTAEITLPLNGTTVSGQMAEFFGDGLDDVASVRGEFYVNDELVYVDPTPGGHYHVGGEHLMWDTTQHADGPATLRLVVVDTAGQTGFAEVEVVIANGGATDGGSEPDAGSGDDAGVNPGDDGGVGGDADGGVDAGSGEQPPVTGSCGCSGGGAGAVVPWLVLSLGGLWSRRRGLRRAAAIAAPTPKRGSAAGPARTSARASRPASAFRRGPPASSARRRRALRSAGSSAPPTR